MSEWIDIAPRGGAFARVSAGQQLRVVDVDGGQVADLYAWSTSEPAEYLSASHTRAVLDKLFPAVGDAFYSSLRRPMVTFERDDTPGVHDMLIASCDPARYAQLGVEGWHASCAENFRAAMEDSGLGYPVVPQSVNLFMAIPVDAQGGLSWNPAVTKPGDSVTLRAVMDCVVVVSACPQDIVPINNLDPTGLAIEVLDP